MSFGDASDFAASIAEAAGAANIDALGDSRSITDRMARRAKLAEAQVKASNAQSKICDQVRPSGPLHERITALRETDPELHEYINKLRYLKYGIWCVQCDKVKQIGGRDARDVERDVQADARGEDPGTHTNIKVIPVSKNNVLAAVNGTPTTSAASRIEQRAPVMSETSAANEAVAMNETAVMNETSAEIRKMDERIAALIQMRNEIIKIRDEFTEKLTVVGAYINSIEAARNTAAPTINKTIDDIVDNYTADYTAGDNDYTDDDYAVADVGYAVVDDAPIDDNVDGGF